MKQGDGNFLQNENECASICKYVNVSEIKVLGTML